MSGIFGVVSKNDCVHDLYIGIDYHSHLGTKYGGMAVFDGKEIRHDIKNISEHPFRAQLSGFKTRTKGNKGIGVVSDYEPQPLHIKSGLGDYAIVHVGKVANLESLVNEANLKGTHFIAMSGEIANPTEVVASLINQGNNFVDGIEIMQDKLKGSSCVMLLTGEGIYLARDKFGRTPVVVGKRDDASAATFETCAFPNSDFQINKYLGPGEIGILTEQGYEQLKAPGDDLKVCDFLYIYYGFPTSNYEGINVELTRNKFGQKAAENDKQDRASGKLNIDLVTGIPDSGIASALGYAVASGLPYLRPSVKYNPTWQRSFMPQEQEARDFVAAYKLIHNTEIIQNKNILSTEDSIVRGTQLQKKIRELFESGANEVHMRPSCPPLTYICKFLNFSRSRDQYDLAARKAMRKVEGKDDFDITPYLNEDSEEYYKMIDMIRADLGLTTLKYPKYADMVKCIGLPEENLCGGCWKNVGFD